MGQSVEYPAKSLGDLRIILREWWRNVERRDLLTVLALFITVFFVSMFRLEASRIAILVNNCIFGADAASYGQALATGKYVGFKVTKHALAVVSIGAIAEFVRLFALTPAVAGSIALAFMNAIIAPLIYVFLRVNGLGIAMATAVCLLALATFGPATLFSIPETYSVTLLAIVVALIAFPRLASHVAEGGVAVLLAAGVIAFALAIANAPAAAFVMVFYSHLPSQYGKVGVARLTLAVAIPLIATFAGIYIPALIAKGMAGGNDWHANYLARYAEISNFSDLTTVLNFMAGALVYAFIAPTEYIRCRFLFTDLAAMADRPLHLIAFGALAALLVFALMRVFRSEHQRTSGGILASVGLILIFYLYFNPDEVLLYSPQWTIPLVMAAGPGMIRSPLLVAGVAALCFAINFPPLFNPKTHDARQCCPIPPETMAPREYPSELAKQRDLREAD